MKLGLGAVQFGTDYGVSNTNGKTPPLEVSRILALAKNNGVRFIDTASLYGESEEVVGRYVDTDFNIVTKSPVFNVPKISKEEASQLTGSLHRSLARLCQRPIYGFLIHHSADLLKEGGNLLLEAMEALKSEGFVQKIGVSVYTAEEIDCILNLFRPDIVQLPVNVFDQRLIFSGHLSKLKRLGVEIHARSIFLQGLLLMDSENIPEYFSPLKDHLKRYAAFLSKSQLSRLQSALCFVSQIPEIDVAIVGVSKETELSEILQALETIPKNVVDMSGFAVSDAAMINPSKWCLG